MICIEIIDAFPLECCINILLMKNLMITNHGGDRNVMDEEIGASCGVLWTLEYDRATNRTIDNANIYINFSTIMDALVVSLFETYKRSIKLSQVVG